MTAPMNMTLYRLLVHMGASEADAEAAARIDTSELATKSDLIQLEVRLQRFIIQITIGSIVALTGIFAIIVGWLH